MTPIQLQLLISALAGFAAFVLVRYGPVPIGAWLRAQTDRYDQVLRRQLLLDIDPRTVLAGQLVLVVLGFLTGYALAGSLTGGLIPAAACYFLPTWTIQHLQLKRRQRLDAQLVDGLTTLASGTRAGLNLIQSMELLATNHTGPLQQEFGQLLREYQMGMDLNQAMRHTAQRIGSPLYRLTFTAIEMHRVRGGDTSQSLDRIADSIREIQRLDGKLDALTAQGRTQARMMGAMPVVFLGLLYLIMPDSVTLLFTDPLGRLILLGIAVTIVVGFVWIKKIMTLDL